MFEIILRIAFFLIGVIAGFICGVLFSILHKAEDEIDKEIKENEEF